MNVKRTFIIAEAGVNHNGDVGIAHRLVDAAAEAGVDAVKFQTFAAGRIVTRTAPKAAYQRSNSDPQETQWDMLKRLQLPEEAHRQLIGHCNRSGILFLSSPFDLESIDLLACLGLTFLKVPSGEITNVPYLRKIGGLGKKLILSTGMADLKEIGQALDVLRTAGTPLCDITVLHCTSVYPTPYEDVNLLAMVTIRDAFGVKVGYSDHTLGIEVPVAAVALGACTIEKHFTLSREMGGPDHAASLEPGELKEMVNAIRHVEIALGLGIKNPTGQELDNRLIARKSIVASRAIKKEEIFTEENLTSKRPGHGMSPLRWNEIIGMKSNRDYSADDFIDMD